MERLDVALATCLELPEPDPDAQPLLDALHGAGVRAAYLPWDDPAADFSRARVTIPRSTWNYPRHLAGFRRWVESTAQCSRLINPVAAFRWNLHKSYLKRLDDAGVPIAPTELVAQGSGETLADICTRCGWEDVFIKPAVGAASYRAARFTQDEYAAGESHLRALNAEGDVLVQQYLEAVVDYGERALVWIDGELTHAVRKAPRVGGQDESVSERAVAFTQTEADVARLAVDAVGLELLYARIDLVPGPAGTPVVMELELMEPSLFFLQGPEALDRFVAAVHRLV